MTEQAKQELTCVPLCGGLTVQLALELLTWVSLTLFIHPTR